MEYQQESAAIMRAMETARREAEQQATEDPNNAQAFLQWGAALLELAQAQEAGEAKVMIELAVSKLKRCLELRPQEHKAEWCLGQCHHALGFMTEEQSEAAALFATMQQHFKRAKTLEPSNPLYAQSVEQAAQALPMWEAVQAQIRRTEQREIQPAGMQPKRPKQKVWMGLSESTWVEIAGWTIAGSVFAGIVIYFNRIGMANQGAQ